MRQPAASIEHATIIEHAKQSYHVRQEDQATLISEPGRQHHVLLRIEHDTGLIRCRVGHAWKLFSPAEAMELLSAKPANGATQGSGKFRMPWEARDHRSLMGALQFKAQQEVKERARRALLFGEQGTPWSPPRMPEDTTDRQPGEPCECEQVQALRQMSVDLRYDLAISQSTNNVTQAALTYIEQSIASCLARMPEDMEHGGCLETAVDLLLARCTTNEVLEAQLAASERAVSKANETLGQVINDQRELFEAMGANSMREAMAVWADQESPGSVL